MEQYVRCAFCLTGSEESVARKIEKKRLGRVLIPRKVKPFRVNGQWVDRTELLMPGYLFVFSEEKYPFSGLKAVDGIVRVLTYGDRDEEGFLTGWDLDFAAWLQKEDGLIGKLDAIQEGDFVRITDGALRDMQGRAVGMNRHRHMVNVEVTLFGAKRNVWLGYEVIKTVPEKPDAAEGSGESLMHRA